jgi:uncharacterized protein YndB with AHSA1/START domain
MFQFEHRVEIASSPADVFALLSDMHRAPEWQSSVESVTGPVHASVRAGSEYVQIWRGPLHRREVSVRVAAYRPSELIAFAGDGGFVDFYCAFELSPAARGCSVVARTEFRLHGLWRLLQPIVAAETKRETAKELAALRAVAEAGSAVTGAAQA